MKKFSVGLIGFVLGLLVTISGVAFAAQSIRVYVDGNEVISDVPAQIINGRTVLPVRSVCEAMGASVSWDEVSNSVYITSKDFVPAPVVMPEPVIEPVITPDIPVDVDVSVPIDTSVTSTVYDTPFVQGPSTVDKISLDETENYSDWISMRKLRIDYNILYTDTLDMVEMSEPCDALLENRNTQAKVSFIMPGYNYKENALYKITIGQKSFLMWTKYSSDYYFRISELQSLGLL